MPSLMQWTRALGRTLALLGLSLLHPEARGSDSIETDRPDFVESSKSMEPGHFQIEASAERAAGPGWSLTTPTLLRLGVFKNTELRLESDGYTRDADVKGMSDLSVGVKFHHSPGSHQHQGVETRCDGDSAHCAEDDEENPSAAWLLHVDFPSGDRELREPGIRPSLRYVIEWDLPQDFTLGAMPGIAWENDLEERRKVGGILGVVLGHSLGERARGLMEIAIERLAFVHNDQTIINFNTGVAYLLTPDLQLDSAVRLGLTQDTPDYAVTIGLSARW